MLAFTHDDVYKPLPGYKVMVSHFHLHFNEQLTDAGTIDLAAELVPRCFAALGINIAILADFHADSHPNDPGPLRFDEQKVYFEGCAPIFRPRLSADSRRRAGRHSRRPLHHVFFPQPGVLVARAQRTGQQFAGDTDRDVRQGLSHGSPADELNMLAQEHGLMWQTHPRTKGSAGYPDAVKDKAHFLSDRFLGGSFQSLPVDQSQKRLCEVRCLDLLDDMNNWAGPKYMIAEGDTYTKYPDDETFPQLIVNYVKLERVPRFGEDWTPIVDAMRAGDYFVSSGEVLLRNWAIEGGGARSCTMADVEWTFPPEFVEVVWGDGRPQSADYVDDGPAPLSHNTFRIPFDPAGKQWIRFAFWDSAGNGAFTQPVRLK